MNLKVDKINLPEIVGALHEEMRNSNATWGAVKFFSKDGEVLVVGVALSEGDLPEDI